MKRLLATTLAILSFAVLTIAAPGDLDLTFNGSGKATVSFGGSSPEARATAIQSDGKIIVAGYATPLTTLVFALARYNSDGTLDTSFDGDGKVTTAISGNNLIGFSVAIQSDGKIVVGGLVTSGFVVVRYNADGSLDTSFDTDGIAFSPNISGLFTGVVGVVGIQQDGKIVIAGGCNINISFDFCVVRFNANGSLDTSFDSDGVVSTSISPNWDYANAVAIQADGKIVVAGQSRNDTDGWDQIAIVRYNTDGSLDTSFDGDGKLTTIVGNRQSSDYANAVAIQSDNKIVVAGRGITSSGGNDFALVRYNSNGSLDTTFDTDGIILTTLSPGTNDQANAVVIQSDGKIIAAGSSSGGSSINDFAFVRYNPDGSLDSSFADGFSSNVFGSGGKVLVDFAGGQDRAFGVSLDSAGRVLATGSSGNDFGTVRLQGLIPLAATVSVSGRVLSSDGRGLSNAVVSLTDSNGNSRTTRTSSFGFYHFDEIEVGQTVVINVRSKRFQFELRVLAIGEDLTDVDFVPIGGNSIKEQ